LLAEKRCLIRNYRAIALHEDFPTRKEERERKEGENQNAHGVKRRMSKLACREALLDTKL